MRKIVVEIDVYTNNFTVLVDFKPENCVESDYII
jgi:hypothetical protein